MAAPVALTPQQSAAIDRRINDLDLRGHNGVEIAVILEGEGIVMTPQAVRARVRKLNAAARLDREAQVERELRTLDFAQAEAIEAWERSKQDAETVAVEEGGKGSKDSPKTTTTTKGQTGDPSHLGNVVRVSESRRKLLGLDAPTRTRNEDGPPIDWDRVPEDVQIAFLEGRIGLADVAKRLQPRD